MKNSSISKLLDMLVKHGTMPNIPVPELIQDAQTELATLIDERKKLLLLMRKAKSIFKAAYIDKDLRMAESYIDDALKALQQDDKP